MFTLPHFCRICLKYDKNLIDLAHIENEPSETLMSKLQFCASEVEWNTYKPLLCHPCIKRLNIAYAFKKECIQSANVLKSYVELLKESQLKNQAQNSAEGKQQNPSGTYMLLPNQKCLKILVGPGGQNQNTFQNVFLNVIPSTSASAVTPSQPPILVPSDSPKNKDTNQNIFLNINNIFKKYVPIAPNENAKLSPVNAKLSAANDKNNVVNQLLTNTKTEELSVEIDPTDFGLVDESDSSPEEGDHDWEDVIATSKINSDVSISRIPSNKARSASQKKEDTKSQSYNNSSYNNYVPILPKYGASENLECDEKMEYFNTGEHFLSSSTQAKQGREFTCEPCRKTFPRLGELKHHINTFHMGKLPYKCGYCYVEFAVRADYELCMKFHKDQEASNNSLTLEDFTNGANPNVSIVAESPPQSSVPAQNEETDDFTCNVCHRVFASSTGLLRHKVRKHNQKNKKKYFIKGMKNAQCDICKREFSTQSYMQLHRKLHLRDVSGYKYKVFAKSKYVKEQEGDKKENGRKDASKENESKNADSSTIETVDCTPDITFTEENMESEGEDVESEAAEKSEDEAANIEVTPIIKDVFTISENDFDDKKEIKSEELEIKSEELEIKSEEVETKSEVIVASDTEEESLDQKMQNGDEMEVVEETEEIKSKESSDECITIKGEIKSNNESSNECMTIKEETKDPLEEVI